MSTLAKYVVIMFAIDMGIYVIRFVLRCAQRGLKAPDEKA